MPSQSSIMLLPTKVVSDKFSQQLLRPEPSAEDSAHYVKAYKEDQKAYSMN